MRSLYSKCVILDVTVLPNMRGEETAPLCRKAPSKRSPHSIKPVGAAEAAAEEEELLLGCI